MDPICVTLFTTRVPVRWAGGVHVFICVVLPVRSLARPSPVELVAPETDASCEALLDSARHIAMVVDARYAAK